MTLSCIKHVPVVTLVGRRGCQYTQAAARRLLKLEVAFVVHYVDDSADSCEREWRGYGTFPQVVVHGCVIPGGNAGFQAVADDIRALVASAQLTIQRFGIPTLWLDQD